jgi:hypothetical protein
MAGKFVDAGSSLSLRRISPQMLCTVAAEIPKARHRATDAEIAELLKRTGLD